ncbi:hypothetical protein NHX12_003347 [Muraenolepis orangiensis]|uniref:Enamelin n=1 Tax=Muraenolepis orangiensis TaxID=630683 RepID=A0A9Q0DY86_9TELE|nr:hypothetical protein NHX12_003347 [Muraenolepis orangiensis]
MNHFKLIFWSCPCLALLSYEPAERSQPFTKGSLRFANLPTLQDLQPLWKAHADSRAKLWAQMETQQKPKWSSVGVSSKAHIPARPGVNRPLSHVFNKPPQEKISPRRSQPIQNGNKRHTTLNVNPEEFPQAKPRSFEFSIKVPFMNKAKDGTPKESDPASSGGHGKFRPSSLQIQTSFNKRSGAQKGSSDDTGSQVDPSKLSYNLEIDVPIPSKEKQETLSTPENPFGNSLDANQKRPWTGQNKPTNTDLYALSVPETPESGAHLASTSRDIFPPKRPTYVNRLNEYYNSQMEPKPATYDYSNDQSGQARSSDLTYMYEQSYPPSVTMPYDKAQHELNDLSFRPNENECSKCQKQEAGVDSQTAISERGNYDQFGSSSEQQFRTGHDEDSSQAIDQGYNWYTTSAPSQYEQVSRPVWNTDTIYQAKNDAVVADSQQSMFKPPAPAGYQTYEYEKDQSKQTLPGYLDAVQQPPPLISHIGTSQMNDKAQFTKSVMEPEYYLGAQVDKLGPVSDYAETSSGLADYSPNSFNQHSQREPLYVGYSTEQQGIVQSTPSTAAFDTYQPNPLASDNYTPIYNSLPKQANKGLQYTANAQADNYYIPDPANYVPFEEAPGSSTLVPLKEIAKPQWQTAALSKSNSYDDQYNGPSSGREQLQIPIKVHSTFKPNNSPSFSSALYQHYYPSEGFDDYQDGKSQVYQPQDVSYTANPNIPQMFPSLQQTSTTFSNKEPALENMNQNAMEIKGNLDLVYTQQGPQYTLPEQSFSQKKADQTSQEAEEGFKVVPYSKSDGYSSRGWERPPASGYEEMGTKKEYPNP